MKKWPFVLLAVALLMPIVAAAQHSSKAAEAKPPASKAPVVDRKAVSISGQISLDGKTLVSEENDIWSVANPNVLAGHEGQMVLVNARCSPTRTKFTCYP